MTLKLNKCDILDYLETEEDMTAYLEACFEEAGDDAVFIAKALGDIAKACNLSQLAQETGLARASLQEALLGEGNRSFATILKVIHALGLKLHIEAVAKSLHGL